MPKQPRSKRRPPKSSRWRTGSGKLVGATRKLAGFPTTGLFPAVLVGVSVAVVSGLISAKLIATDDDRERTSKRSAVMAASCQPAMDLRAEDPILPRGARIVPTPLAPYTGNLEGGDILRVKTGSGEFQDAVTARPGEVVQVGVRLSNGGPGDIGEPRMSVRLPASAGPSLDLNLTGRFIGGGQRQQSTDDARVLVEPSGARACLRYVPGSLVRRQGDYREELPGDSITTADGFSDGFSIGPEITDVRFFYFKVLVI